MVELASVLAGPAVGAFFAELGARVIKIENPHTGGDVTRGWRLAGEECPDGVSAYFSSVNWGKESRMLDLRDAAQRETLRALVRQADVLIVNFKPGDAEKLGFGYAALEELNPRLIYAAVTGYGPDNPRVGYDALVQAEAGYVAMNGPPEGPGCKMPVALVDLLAAHQLKEAVLAALWLRERTGRGRKVEVGLFQAAVAALINQATGWLMEGSLPRRLGTEHPSVVPYGAVYPCRDGELMVAVGNDRQFKALCEVLALPELAGHVDFATNAARVNHRERLHERLSGATRSRERDELIEDLRTRDVPAGAIHTMAEVFKTPEAAAMVLREGRRAGVRHVAFEGIPRVDRLTPPPELPQS